MEENKNADINNNPGGDDPVALQQYLSHKPFAHCTEWERAFRMRYLDLSLDGVESEQAVRTAYRETTNALGVRPYSPAEVDKLRHQLWEAESRCKVLAEKVEDWERRYKAADQANASEVHTLRKDVALLKQDLTDKEAEHEQDLAVKDALRMQDLKKLIELLGAPPAANWDLVFTIARSAGRALQAQNHHEHEQPRKLAEAERALQEKQPSLGDVVLYVNDTEEAFAAIVTGLCNDPERSVSLTVFLQHGRTPGLEAVPAYAPGTHPRKCWKWRP